jgi:hypothetical protein
VIRAAFALTLVLTLGTGGSATLLCQAFCDRAAAAGSTEACRHNQPTDEPSLTSDASCTTVDLTATAVIRVEQNRSTLTAPGDAAASALTTHTPAATPGHDIPDTSALLTLGNQPRNPILRI